MDDYLPKNVCTRKSAFGRTDLFLQTTGARFREVNCSSSIQSKQLAACLYHNLNSMEKPSELCWHCCTKADSVHMRVPRLYDPEEKMYHVYGWFCSAACGKGYILEHSHFDRGYQMNVFVRMLKDVYNIHNMITAAPPRISLKAFGGPFDIEAFRKQCNICIPVTPPFVSYCMLVEERKGIESMGEEASSVASKHLSVKGLKRPTHPTVAPPDNMAISPKTSVYDNFLESERDATGSICDTNKKKRDRDKNDTSSGASGSGLARFQKV